MSDSRHFLSAIIASILSISATAGGISDEDLIGLFGEATVYRSAFSEVQSTIEKDDREGFAALVHYPFTIYRDKEECCGAEAIDTIEISDEFMEKFDEIVTTEVRQVIQRQKFDDLILNWRGLGFELGAVWIVGHCVAEDVDDACAETIVGVKYISTDTAKLAAE